jgi:polysaccharide export outer membrane protein
MAIAALAGGCSAAKFDAHRQWTVPAGSIRALSFEPAQYQLSSGDKIKVTVFGQTNVTGEYQIDETGMVTLPLGGPIRVKGMTAAKAALFVAQTLKAAGDFRDPRVSIELVAYAPVYVLGEVNRPGEFVYRPGLSLFSAVALAGGFTYRANQNRVYVRGNDERIETDYKIRSDIAIYPGDVIRVPEVTLLGGH